MTRTKLSLILSIFVLATAAGCEEESYTPRCVDSTGTAIDAVVPFNPDQLVVETEPDSGEYVRVAPVPGVPLNYDDAPVRIEPASNLTDEQFATREAAIKAGCLTGVSVHIPITPGKDADADAG